MYVIHFFSQYVIDSQSLLFLINYYTAISWAKYFMCYDFFSSFYHLYIFSISPLCNDAYLCHMRKYFYYALRYQFSNLYIQKWCKVFFDLGIIKSINMLRLIFLNSFFYFIFRLCISNCLIVLSWSLLIYLKISALWINPRPLSLFHCDTHINSNIPGYICIMI